MRFRGPATRFYPEGAAKRQDELSSAVVYSYEAAGVPYAVAYHGKANKPDWHHRFRSNEQREAKILSHFESQRLGDKHTIEQREKRKTEGHGLEVGDILSSSWGYDQTNVDYYQVTAIIGKQMVELREIAGKSKAQDVHFTDRGSCVPDPDNFTGAPFRKMARNGYVRLNSFSGASKEAFTVQDGQRIYASKHWSSYA